MKASEVKALIEAGLSGAQVDVVDTTGTGDHFEAKVVWDGYEGKSLVERHQAVYRCLGAAMAGPIHALTLKTLTPAEGAARR